MKLFSLTLLALCIIIGSASAQLTCPNRNCAKATEVCGPTGNNTYTGCGADSYCTGSSEGFGNTLGVCVIPFKLGDVCESAPSNCESGTTCSNPSGSLAKRVCALNQLPEQYLYAGEGCSDDKQCRTDSPYSDDNSDRCRSGKCKHVKNGDYCDPSISSRQQCNYGTSYCSRTHQCTKYISHGDACYFSDESENGCGKDYYDTCVPNGLNGDAGTCQSLHSRKAGQYCKNIDDCKEGLFCRTRSGDDFGICSEITDTQTINKVCTSNLDCTSDNTESCQCGTDGVRRCYANVRPDGYHNAQKSYQDCIRKKGCSASSGFIGCVMDKCKSQYCKYNKVLQKSPYATVSCQYEGICNSAFSLVASPVLALLAFIVVLAL